MKAINPYLNLNGNAEEVFSFYKSVLGGELTALIRYKEVPESNKVPEKDKEKIMHISLPVGNKNILMGTDYLESLGQHSSFGNNFFISISADSKEEVDKIFSRLSEGGKVMIALGDAFWGEYFGMFEDKFGIQWMVKF